MMMMEIENQLSTPNARKSLQSAKNINRKYSIKRKKEKKNKNFECLSENVKDSHTRYADQIGADGRKHRIKIGMCSEVCCRLIGKDMNTGSVNRTVLEIIAKEAGMDYRQVYRSVLDVCFSASLDYSQFDDLDDRDLESLYRGDNSSVQSPYFVDFVGEVTHRQALEEVTGRQLVLLQRKELNGPTTILHDFRMVTLSSRCEAKNLEARALDSQPYCTTVVLESRKMVALEGKTCGHTIFDVWQCRRDDRPISLLEERKYLKQAGITEKLHLVNDNMSFFHTVNAILAGPPGKPALEILKKEKNFWPEKGKDSLTDIGANPSVWKSLFLEHPADNENSNLDSPLNFLLVSYTGRDLHKCAKIKAEHFFYLCHFYESRQDVHRSTLLESVRILGVSTGRFVYEILDKKLIDDLRTGPKQHFVRLDMKRLGLNINDLNEEKKEGDKEGDKDLRPEKNKNKKLKKKYNRRSGRYQTEHEARWKFECPCQVCLAASHYAENMMGRTPGGRYQFPLAYNLSVEDYVRVLNLGDDVMERVRLASKLSLASYDLESINRELWQGDEALTQEGLELRISDVRLPRRVLSRQSILLIGYTDSLAKMKGENVVVLDVRDHNGSTNRLVDSFLHLLRKRQQETTDYKAELLQDVGEWLRAHHMRHSDYYRQKCPKGEEKDYDRICQKLWRQNFLGRFELCLWRLVRKFVVSAFNASGYDLIMLSKKLVRASYASGGGGCFSTSGGGVDMEFDSDENEDKESGKKKYRNNRIKINRQGNDISSMQIGDISFQDAKKLVAPGASLASVAKMCGSQARLASDEGSKGIFPFSKLTSSDYLNERHLPCDPEAWKSDIGSKAPDAEEVAAALRLFEERGFQNVGDYLVYYLHIDVNLLQDCTERLFDMTIRVQQVNFVDRHAFTAASVSHASSNGQLMRDCRIGMYATNDARIFSMMRDTSCGGLTVVRRTLCGDAPEDLVELVRESQNKYGASKTREEFETLYACNGHLVEGAERPVCVACFDVNSLYPASCVDRGLPFGPGKFYTAGVYPEARCLNKYKNARAHFLGESCPCRSEGIPIHPMELMTAGVRPNREDNDNEETIYTVDQELGLNSTSTEEKEEEIVDLSDEECHMMDETKQECFNRFSADQEDRLLLQNSDRAAGDGQEFLWSQYRTLQEQKRCSETEPGRLELMLATSDFHVGPGQMSLGACDSGSRCDLFHAIVDHYSKTVRLHFQNFHGRNAHNLDRHWEHCHKWNVEGSTDQVCSYQIAGSSEKQIEEEDDRTKTDRLDLERKKYCDWMSENEWRAPLLGRRPSKASNDESDNDGDHEEEEVDAPWLKPPPRLMWEYSIETDCSVFCNDFGGVTLNEFLKSAGDDAVLPIRHDNIKVSELFDLLDSEHDLSGFVTLSGGHETDVGDVEDEYGFCMQRLYHNSQRIGPYTRAQLNVMGSDNPQRLKHLEKTYMDPRKTMTTVSKSFSEKGVTVSLEYLRWLVRERGFRNYRIFHLYLTRIKHYQTPWFDNLLQTRYEMRDDPLLNQCAKLCVNSNYGRFGMMSSRYQATDLITRSTFRRKPDYFTNLSVVHFNLMCVVVRPRVRSAMEAAAAGKHKLAKFIRQKNRCDALEFVYGLTYQRPDLEFANYQTTTGFILNQSRIRYFNHMLDFARLFDPRRAEDCYGDTDSVMWTLSRRRLEENYRETLTPEQVTTLEKKLFEEPDSLRHQTGKMKLEHIHRYAVFRNQKTYKLYGEYNKTEDEFGDGCYVRIRSISRRLHGAFQDRHFAPDPEVNSGTARARFMRKTPNLQMIIVEEDRSLPHCLNLRRHVEVSYTCVCQK